MTQDGQYLLVGDCNDHAPGIHICNLNNLQEIQTVPNIPGPMGIAVTEERTVGSICIYKSPNDLITFITYAIVYPISELGSYYTNNIKFLPQKMKKQELLDYTP
jgi:hypothetical protein